MISGNYLDKLNNWGYGWTMTNVATFSGPYWHKQIPNWFMKPLVNIHIIFVYPKKKNNYDRDSSFMDREWAKVIRYTPQSNYYLPENFEFFYMLSNEIQVI